MEPDVSIISWKAKEYEFVPKTKNWYWAVGILAAGIAIASFILLNILFGIIALIGGFAVMLVGSRPPIHHTYSLNKKGIAIGREMILYEKIKRFAIVENEPRSISLETMTLSGTVTIPLGSADHRVLRTELKNRNIDEVESLDSFTNKVADVIGL